MFAQLAIAAVTVRAGIADNPTPTSTWKIVQNLSPDLVCLCVHGDRPCSEAWLTAALAQVPAADLVLVGASVALPGHADARRYADIDTPDPQALASILAARMPGQHLLIVRSDAELPPLALARLLRAIGEADVLAAGPLDNLHSERSPLPTGARSEASVERIDKACFDRSQHRLIDCHALSPLASAWHGDRLLRRDRIPPAGRRVCLDHLYVAEPGRVLEGPAADPDPRDPLPPSPLADLRASVAEALAVDPGSTSEALDQRPRILHVLHGWGGGAERWVRDFCSAYSSARHLVLIARGSHARRRHGEWLELHDGALNGPPLQRIALPCSIADTVIEDSGYRRLLAELIAAHAIDAVIVSSLIGHSLDVLRTGLPTVRIVHDHYPLWPVLHRDFSDPALRFDDLQRRDDLAALGSDREFTNPDPSHWKQLRDATVEALLAARTTLIAPSRSALDNDLRLAPELAALQSSIIPHGLSAWPRAPAPRTEPPHRSRLRLVIPGRVRRGKGAQLLEQVLPRLREYADVFLLGAGSDAHAFFGMDGVHILLDYRREELPDLLAGIAPDAAMLLPTVAETFGYTLSELRDLGLAVIATRMGAYAERIEDGVDGFLVEANADAIVARVSTLFSRRESLPIVRRHVAERGEPGLAAMASAYAKILDLPATPATRYPLGGVDIASQLLASRSSDLVVARRRIGELQDSVDALRSESTRRGEWGHGLDRELVIARENLARLEADLEQRTEWALRLDSEVESLRPMLDSRSWRYTEPLRATAARLRAIRVSLAYRRNRLLGQLRRAQGSLARHGLAGTWARLVRELRGGSPVHGREVFAAPDEAFSPFAVPTSASPRVSIVIPVHNKFPYTAACLRSLGAHASTTAFEVIVVDDLSTDTTESRLARIDGIRSIRNAENLGFVGSCNAGAAIAIGEYVLFLNNDTVVTAGWLDALLRCFDEQSDAGLVGSRLVYPDGRLQEAGGIIFNDGSGWNYGRFEDPNDTRFAFRREVDYCSGAAIMLRRDLFETLGRFDGRYAPAYYEDTDLAFAVRAAGLKVYYEPRSRVVHFEGITAGTDTGSGMKRYQVVNQAKFVDKWRDALRGQPEPATPIHLAATHRARHRILVIDATTPAPDQDAGSLRMVNLMRVLRDSGCHVVFMASNRAWIERYTADLQDLGIEVLHHPYHSEPVALFRERGPEFDAIVLSRHYVAREFIGLARLYAPRARLVFDTVDLHYLRETREAELEGRADLMRSANATRTQELAVMRDCDVTLVVSTAEREILGRDAPAVKVDVLATVNEIFGCRKPFAERHDLVFVGGFQHPPNIDSVLWFVREIFPLVLARKPGMRLHVVGSKATAAIRALGSEHVIIHGFVEDIARFMDDCRVSIAPVRYGAGIKGKINTAMSYGLPVVATPTAIEGMHLRAGEDVLVAAEASGFADAVVRLHDDEVLWNRLSANGLANVREHFSFEAAEKAVRRIFAL
ncbi:MAG: glycosyltransferase [Dokdonella sp.]|uniref:glycosyltransferase n=1 Tax=Dokdonella sp. TaxID=2291710 RepID=UPI003BAEC411